MRGCIPEMAMAMLLWIWIGIVVVFAACRWLMKWWKRRHLPPKPESVRHCAQRLQRCYHDRRPHGRSGSAADLGELRKKRQQPSRGRLAMQWSPAPT